MNEHENVNVVKDAYRAFAEGNLDELLAVLDDCVKWFSIGPPHLIPTAGTRYGPEQVEQYFSLLRSSGQLKGCWPLEFIAEGDKVVTIGEWLSEVRASGSMIRSPWVHVFTLRDGKICEFRSFLRYGGGAKRIGKCATTADQETQSASRATSDLLMVLDLWSWFFVRHRLQPVVLELRSYTPRLCTTLDTTGFSRWYFNFKATHVAQA